MAVSDIAQTGAEEKIAQSIVPYNRDDDRARYLGLRSSGFTINEALKLIGRAKSTLSLWRHDEEFSNLEKRIPEFRRHLSLEYANLEFLRNYRLILEKDCRVIKASLYPDKDASGNAIPMPSADIAYLLKMRSNYTPQQLQIIEALIRAEGEGKGGFDFTNLIVTLFRKTEGVRIEPKPAVLEVSPEESEV